MEAVPLTTAGNEMPTELHSVLLRSPAHIDLTAEGISLDDFGCGVLRSHLMHYAVATFLNLAGCGHLTEKGYGYLREAVENGAMAKLQYMGLSAVRPPPVVFTDLLLSLRRHSHCLTHLVVSDNELGDEIADRLRAAMPPSLLYLDISGNRLTGKGLSQIFEGVMECDAALEFLDTSFNTFSFRASEVLCRLLTSPKRRHSLRELYMCHCRLDEVTSLPIAHSVYRLLELQVLDLSDNDVAMSFALPMADGGGIPQTSPAALSTSTNMTLPASLRVLNLCRNVVKLSLVRPLCAALRPCSANLQELYLTHCLVGDDSLRTFIAELPAWDNLLVLDLSDCALSFSSGVLFQQLLPRTPLLSRLLLNDNVFHIDGALDLAAALVKVRHLTALQLGSCHLGCKGSVSIVSGIVQSTMPLRELSLADNGINDAGMHDLCEIMSRLTYPRLETLDLSANPITPAALTDIERMVEDRQTTCTVYTGLEEEAEPAIYGLEEEEATDVNSNEPNAYI